MGDLATLRTAKQALSEGLLNEEDFAVIKTAFLKAQQIKAGLDAGFIREEDYVQARDSFLHSLDFSTGPGSAPSSAAAPPSAPARFPPPPQGPSSAAMPPRSSSGGAGASAVRLPGSPSAGRAAPVPPPSPPPAAFGGGGGAGSTTPGSTSRPPPSGANGWGSGTVEVPADLPKLGKPNPAAGKKSMSGIGLSDQCVNIFNHIKTRKAYAWVTYKIDDAGHEVTVDQVGAPSSTFDQFVAALPSNHCRYAVYDFAYNNADMNKTQNKLVFLHWAPEGSTVKSKMMYASTKDLAKGFMEGVSAELQADTYAELSESEMCDRVHASLTRK